MPPPVKTRHVHIKRCQHIKPHFRDKLTLWDGTLSNFLILPSRAEFTCIFVNFKNTDGAMITKFTFDSGTFVLVGWAGSVESPIFVDVPLQCVLLQVFGKIVSQFGASVKFKITTTLIIWLFKDSRALNIGGNPRAKLSLPHLSCYIWKNRFTC